ncbi:ATP phosphoribosyltransferase catalytic subunit [Desulfonispora thiosulfatigenes DSM 11270]|uniref:ATP phosphoribosyltransferase n=1 Tax=Desulfonispora thiosulfatigenes DSM 11270 TaxID=656914 RepID=A0A1W1V3T5_DESTI|nr:ATP phosphoribosyltransferase [Desulfonispora thiosulfatigenes]SMB88077.1 ATP phosphoribosyltransferase catalytic subunit [Desulfonispora thiosulfatigenes DSM 11270]
MLTLAVSKGRILDETNELLIKAGIIKEPVIEGRKLVIEKPEDNLRFILAKPKDVPTYVQYGVADAGIVGKDVLHEKGKGYYELTDLKIGLCRLSLCGIKDKKNNQGEMIRIATSYPNVTADYFRTKGQQVEIIYLNGSVELAPLLGLSDYIVDIVSTGTTLRENGLEELEKIEDITCRLIVNQATYHLKNKFIDEIVEKLERGLSQ